MTFSHQNIKRRTVTIHKKNDRQCLKQYRPVSLIPVCGKILECLIFNEVFTHFNINDRSYSL